MAGSATAASTDEPVDFGMGPGSIEPQQNHGVSPDYQTIWIGPWTLESGWGGVNDQLEHMRSQGVTPVIHYYYWGDDISPTCVEEGCWSDLHNTHKYKEEWQELAHQLVHNIEKTMDGDPVVILLETEFNKNGMEDYEPFDQALASKADFFHHEYPASEVVLPYGNWKSWAWGTYDETASAADYVGIQGMRGSTRDSWDSYHNLYEATLEGAQKMQDTFGKPVFLHDIALSSYPEHEYKQAQANELSEFFEGMDELKAAGVDAMIYRGWHNNPHMDTNNYYGEAERHWGLAYSDGTEKPSAQVWIDGVQSERDGSPVASFDANVNGRAVQLDASASTDPNGDELTYVWDFGDGHRAEGVQVEHTYDEPGTYDVHMSVSDGENKDTAYMAVTVENGQPEATFTADADGRTVSFDASASTDPDGDELSYVWDFGDGHRARGAQVEHTFAEDGTYDIYMSAYDDETRDTAHRELTVDNSAPDAALELSTDGLALRGDASGSTDPEGDDLTYVWDFGDGHRTSGAEVNHTYDREGSYDVYMSAYDEEHRDTIHRVVEIDDPGNQDPEASYTVEKSGLDASFDASASTDPDGDELSYVWDFGDGDRARGAQVNHTFAEPGTYDVHMSVDDGLTKTTAHQTVTVGDANEAPAATYEVTKSGLEASFDASASTDPDGDDLTYVWDFGDGDRARGAQVDHTFAEPGTYDVHMSAYDGEHKDTAHQTVTVGDANDAPAATFEANAAGLDASFDASASSDPDGDDLSYVWDFGDGDRAHGAQVDHTFAEPGTYEIHMSVSDGEHKDTARQVLTVGNPLSADFTPKSQGNEWWVEVGVDADADLAKVEFRDDGGDWVELDRKDWGNWAKSVHVASGSEVEFRATSPAGETDTSRAYTW